MGQYPEQIPGLGGLSRYSQRRITCSPTLEEIWRTEMLISEEELRHAIGVLLEQCSDRIWLNVTSSGICLEKPWIISMKATRIFECTVCAIGGVLEQRGLNITNCDIVPIFGAVWGYAGGSDTDIVYWG
ncbi:hypothetical protein B0H14DRAFT_2617935 [Mycena olivaceomarginata]|nr:hypothetical protein B0H14DRAFT_2617935 [Mycena olivaceomarginata]